MPLTPRFADAAFRRTAFFHAAARRSPLLMRASSFDADAALILPP